MYFIAFPDGSPAGTIEECFVNMKNQEKDKTTMAKLKAAIRRHGGVPVIHVNGVPVTGLMHWNRNMDTEDVRNFAEAGVRIFSFIGNVAPEDGTPVHDGSTNFQTMTPEFIDSMMEKILRGYPDALVIPRFRLHASDGWKARHPGCLMRLYDLETLAFEDCAMATLWSDEWIDDALESLGRSLEYCERHWGESILGYHSGFGHCAEHVWYWGAKIADYHPQMAVHFRRWLSERYRTDEALRKAWNDSSVTLENAEPPPPERFRNFNPSAGSLLNPETEQALIDHLLCHSERMAGLVVRQAEHAKRTLARLGAEKLFGAFYCYANLPTNSIAHYAAGQDAHRIVLECRDLDYLSSPVGYSARQPGGVSTAQMLPASAELAGKLYFAEDDTGTHLSVTPYSNVLPVNVQQAEQMMTRGFLDVWRSGGTQWFMDLFGEGTFRDRNLMENVARLATFAGRHLEQRESTAQIAVFLSDRSLSCSKTFQFLTGALIEQQLNEIAAIGASYDIFRIEDLPELVRQNRLSQYRFAIMLNLHFLNGELRRLIDSELKKENRTVLWFHAPGIFRNGRFDADGCCEVTGIRCVLAEGQRSSLITEVLIDGKRFSYGTPRNVNPRLYGADPEAEALGWIVEGTWTPYREGANGAMLLEKHFPQWTSIWSSSPNMPSALLSMFAERAGVHLYSSRGDQVFQSKQWLGVHCKWNGPLELRFPERGSWRDAFSGVLLAENTDCIRLETQRGENLLLERV